jgi:hypothetical protein
MADFKIGDAVQKRKGYSFRGRIVAKFHTLSGNIRYVVEHATEVGMLHIYSGEQLEQANG